MNLTEEKISQINKLLKKRSVIRTREMVQRHSILPDVPHLSAEEEDLLQEEIQVWDVLHYIVPPIIKTILGYLIEIDNFNQFGQDEEEKTDG